MPTSPRYDPRRPVIGLSCYREQAGWGAWHQPADLLPANYADVVAASGGVPVLLPSASGRRDDARAVADRIDGLIISGGADLDPASYGAEPHPESSRWRPERDRWESLLLDAAAGRGLPVLGICRGMQLLAVHAGGSLDQHVPDTVEHDQHSPGGDAFGDITVSVKEGSRLAGILGLHHSVGCHHHQAVLSHPGYTCVARAEDGTIEALEGDGDRFVVGVQWHPEAYAQQQVIAALVDAARMHQG